MAQVTHILNIKVRQIYAGSKFTFLFKNIFNFQWKILNYTSTWDNYFLAQLNCLGHPNNMGHQNPLGHHSWLGYYNSLGHQHFLGQYNCQGQNNCLGHYDFF